MSGILAGLADDLGFEFSRRFIDLPPVGYYDAGQDYVEKSGDDAYSFIDGKANTKYVFLPIRDKGLE